MQDAVKEVRNIRDDKVRMYSLEEQLFPILCISQPIIKTALARHSVLCSPAYLLHCLPLSNVLRPLQVLPLK